MICMLRAGMMTANMHKLLHRKILMGSKNIFSNRRGASVSLDII